MPSSIGPLKNLESLPRNGKFEAYKWADYIELLCLTSIDGEISKADIYDRFLEREDLGELEALDPIQDLPTAEEKDELNSRIDDLFSHLNFREGVFHEFYPFEATPDGNTLIIDRGSLSPNQMLYLFLLLASNLRYVKSHHPITTSFEVLCHAALVNYLPPAAEVHIFGTSAGQLGSPRYTGSLWSKVQRLAEDLHETVKAKKQDFASSNNADGGLDLVAWVPFGDSSEGMLVIFGQCACTDAWKTKQHSSSSSEWGQKISQKAPTNNIVFIPFLFRKMDGSWHASHEFSCILVDRLRLIRLLKDSADTLTSLPANAMVSAALEQRMTLF